MKLSALLGLNGVLAFLFGLGFLILPGWMLAAYGAEPTPALSQMARFYGSAMLGYGALTWLARNVDDSPARRAIARSLMVSFAVGVVVALWGQKTGVVNALGWLTVALYLFFTLGYGYLQNPKKS